MDHSLVYLNETKPCHVGPSEMDGSWWRVLKDKTCSTGEGNGKSLQYSYLENPMNSMKRQKDMTLKHELLGWLVSYCYEGKSGEITPERRKR